MIQLCASTYAYSLILLYYKVSIIMVEIHILIAIIPALKGTKWLLKITRFEEYSFKFKIKPMPMCDCPCFHNKPKRLEYLPWHLVCLVDWVYLLRILNSHYLFVYFHKYSSTKNKLQDCSRILGLPRATECGLQSST